MCDLLFDDGLLPLLVSVTWVSQHGVTSCKAHKLDGRLMSARLFNCSATKRLPPSAGGPVVRSPAGSDSHVRRAPRRFGAALTNSRRRSPSLTFRVRLPRRTEHTAAERLSEGGGRKLRQSLAQNSAQRPTPAPLIHTAAPTLSVRVTGVFLLGSLHGAFTGNVYVQCVRAVF